jgi:N-acyl-D-aspartate/D-glutamate deacylase
MAKSKISQKVTTDCVGNCGFLASPFPKDPERREELLKKMIWISEMQDLDIRFHTIEGTCKN